MAKSKQTGTEFIDALPADGERRLMLAVLIDAIRNLAQGSVGLPPRQRLAWLRDRAWMQRDDMMEPFSFVNICAVLGLSPGYVRRRVRLMQEQHDLLRVHRYAAKVEESWERQRRRVDAPEAAIVIARRERPHSRAPRPQPARRAGRLVVDRAAAVPWR